MLTFLSRKRLIGVEQILVNIIESAIINSPFVFQIAWMGGKRNKHDQLLLYMDGKSMLDGETRISEHQKGRAFDVVCYDENGNITWDVDVFTEVAHYIMYVAEVTYGIELIWGGDWKSFADRPHFQLPKTYKSIKTYG